ncbi:MAG: nucleoside deaminase [Saprospiraceae bacterium]|nr:nucleoside deaminase [Saprospiraceae bacterium]
MNFTIFSDEHFMKLALQQAHLALEQDEIPVGAIVVCQNQIIARAFNRTEALQDVTAHAEILALTTATEYLGSKYLTDCTLYVTLEPCVMCAGALKWAQLDRLVFGASDEKEGFMRYGKELLHPQTKIEMGLLEEPCSQLLKDFFKSKRALSKLK